MAVAFDAVGAGGTGTTNVTPVTWSHTCTGTNGALIVAMAVHTAGAAGSFGTVTYGGVNMTTLITVGFNNNNTIGISGLFGLLASSTGAHTVSVPHSHSGMGQQLRHRQFAISPISCDGNP